jgi:hypothetical protein
LILLLVFGFLKILNARYISSIVEKGFVAVIITGLIMLYANMFRKKALNGILDGTLIFNVDRILFNGRAIEIQEIQKIFLRANDYEGREFRQHKRAGFSPNISNGTNNLLDIDLKNGEKIKLFFKIEYESQIEELQPFIISLIKYKLITEEKAIELLRLDNDYILNRFQEELNKRRA